MAAVGAVMSAAAPYILGASAGMQVLGGIAGASSASEAGKAQADAYNQQADAAMAQSKNQAAQERDKYNRLAASQRANLGASGLDVNSGSALDVLADTDAEGAMSAMQLLYSGKLEAWNAKQKAAYAKYEAKSQSRSSLLGGIMGGLTTGLMGASQLGLLGDKAAGAGAATAGAAAGSGKYWDSALQQYVSSPVRH